MMYFSDHNPPHCHAKYSGHEAVFDFEGKVLQGEMPGRAAGFVREWINKHKNELAMNWLKAQAGEPLDFIAPME